MKQNILTMLRQGEGYISGQQICSSLGVSRTAVWKVINALKSEGYEIEALPNRGYRLLRAPDVLTQEEVASLRCDLWKDSPTAAFAVTDSTNTQINRMTEEGAPQGTLAVADVQTGGKGRRGHVWESPSGVHLAMSFLLRPAFAPDRASMLTLIAALAGKRAVEELAGVSVQIKWPNDLIIQGRKICGILTEMRLEEDYIAQVVVGMGFNVGQDHFEGDLADKATSLYMETGKRWSRAWLCCLVMKYFAELYSRFEETCSLEFLREEYNACLVNRGREVRILAPEGEWRGIAQEIDREGALLVALKDGSLRKVTSGEVSVRGIYGYV